MDLASKVLGERLTSDRNIVAMLSLKLLLLAFFILLASMSKFEEERSRAVIESVKSTFRGHIIATREVAKPDAALGQLDGAPSLAQQIESLFKQTLPAVEVETNRDGTVLRLEAPASSLFEPGSAKLASGRGVLLERLARAINKPRKEMQFAELQFVHAVAPGALPDENAASVLRGGAVARRLADLGLARDGMSVGLWPTSKPAKRDRIAFEIRLTQSPVQPGRVEAPAEGGR